jgi:chitinase
MLFALAMGLALFLPAALLAGPCKNVMIYYTSWSKYNSPAYNYSTIPYSQITHIAYAFIEPNADGSLSITGDYMGSDGVHYDGVSMIAAAHAAGVKVLLSCGGAGSGVSANYTTISASSSLINTFANNLLTYCRANGFDGVDLDWEYPNTATTSNQFDTLLAGIRAVMPSPQWLLTAALSADSYSPTFLHISTLNTYLSFFNLMCYDYHGSWLTHSGDNAPLFEDSQDPAFSHTASGVTAVNYYISNGASASKINYGLPFYGYGFNTSALYQNCGGNCNTTTLTYAQIAPLVGAGWTRNWDSSSDSPNITYNAGASVISYDDSESVSMKTDYVLHTMGVAGVFAWSGDQDYNGSTQPLLTAMYQAASLGCAPTNTPTITPTPTWTGTATYTPTAVVASTWRVNAGGPNYTDTKGNLWIADTNFTGGTAATATGTVGGTTDPTLYASQRYGASFSYSFNVPAGSYQVLLKFAETYSGDYKVGARVFNITINGAPALTNFDIYAAAGGNTAVDETFNNILPSGGVIKIQFTGTASSDPNPVVEALQIISMPATSTFTPTASFTSTTAANTATETNTLSATATSTNSFTPTLTSSNTPTASYTSTLTFTTTKTLTPTATVSSTATNTPSGTLTPVMTSTASMTATASATASFTTTSTYSVTPTFTNTPMNTFTKTATLTSTNTPIVVNTLTYTLTPSATVTNSPTATRTGTSTLTNTMTATGTATPTYTYSFTVTPTPSATSTWTNTNTSTPTQIAFTPTNTRTFTATPVPATNTPTMIGCSGLPNWNGGFVAYAAGQKVNYNGEVYQCLQGHTSEPNWMPPAVPALWKDLGACGFSSPVATSPVVYPNPATSDTTNIQLPISDAVNVKVSVFTIAMREVKNLTASQVTGNVLTVTLTDKAGMRLADGLYYFVIQTNGQKWMNKVLVLR